MRCSNTNKEGLISRGFLGLKLEIKSEFECHDSVIFNWEIHITYPFLPFPLSMPALEV